MFNTTKPQAQTMSLYEQVKQLNDEQVNSLIKVGFLKSTFKRNVQIYERYLDYLEKKTPSRDAVAFVSEDFGISDRYVYLIIRKFSEAE